MSKESDGERWREMARVMSRNVNEESRIKIGRKYRRELRDRKYGKRHSEHYTLKKYIIE